MRDRPWKLLLLILVGTFAMVATAFDLLDGKISLRRLGTFDAATAPLGFWAFVFVYVLLGWGCIIFGWAVVLAEWKRDRVTTWKAPIDDPSHRRQL